ncbi:MAG TPA: hydantoinase/oxoprolinase family protein, partial [Candidatus Acetothermia bacterium]|nr:hydantoinase/oxoprolinase family protein [Candidatus Acetothermia bacterium]
MLLGIDIGGTFTDIVVSDAGHVRLFKIPSTPQKPAVGVISALSNLIEREVIIPDRVGEIRHGSTVATNALLEGKWARTALVTTRGFRDVLEIGRQNRPKLYDLFFERPAPIVARDQRFEVTERLDYCGKVIKPLVTDDVERLIPLLREQSVETVAVVFLFSYLDPTHERAVQDVISSALGVPVTISSDILPEFREFERTSTTVISAALRPVIGSYLTSLETGAKKIGLNTRWQIMQSNGAITSADYAQANPARILLSGPAAGVEGARV